MSCKHCEIGIVETYVRVGNGNVKIEGCGPHLKQLLEAYNQGTDVELDQSTPTSTGDSKPPKHSCTAEIIAELERLKEWNGATIVDGKRIDGIVHRQVIEGRIKELKAKETQL